MRENLMIVIMCIALFLVTFGGLVLASNIAMPSSNMTSEKKNEASYNQQYSTDKAAEYSDKKDSAKLITSESNSLPSKDSSSDFSFSSTEELEENPWIGEFEAGQEMNDDEVYENEALDSYIGKWNIVHLESPLSLYYEITDKEKFWVYAKAVEAGRNDAFLLMDVYGNVCNTCAPGDFGSKEAEIKPLGYNLFAYSPSARSEIKLIDKDGNDLTNQYIPENKTLSHIVIDEERVVLVTLEIKETYAEQDRIYELYDMQGNSLISFSSKQLSADSGIEWHWNGLALRSAGEGIYVEDVGMSSETVIVDTMRKKVFYIDDAPRRDEGKLSCEGSYLQYGQMIFDLETGDRWPFNLFYNNEYYTLITSLSDGLACARGDRSGEIVAFNIRGEPEFVLDGKGSKVVTVTKYHNGYAMMELKNDGGTKYVVLIDTKGNWVFDPIKGSINLQEYNTMLDRWYFYDNEDHLSKMITKEGKITSTNVKSIYECVFANDMDNHTATAIYVDHQEDKLVTTKFVY